MKVKCIGIIPARFGSTRFPGKPLVSIAGKPMIQWVYEQACKAALLTEVVVATDDQRILETVLQFGGKCRMTSSECISGTDRCAEVLQHLDSNPELIVNLQGDEPFVQAEQIDQLVELMIQTSADIGTLGCRISQNDVIFNPNVVKLTKAVSGKALYFSRNPIPFVRGKEKGEWLDHAHFYRHLGMYAFKAGALKEVASLPQGMLENAESLEQLRWLEAGYSIYVAETSVESIGIDTPDDLKWVEENWDKLRNNP